MTNKPNDADPRCPIFVHIVRQPIWGLGPILSLLFGAHLLACSDTPRDQNDRGILSPRSISSQTTESTHGDWVSERPRLFFTSERINGLIQSNKANQQANKSWQSTKEEADRLLREKLVSKDFAEGGTGQHGNYGRPSSQAVKMATVLGLAYRMTGTETYASKLRDTLIHFGTLSRWAGDAHHNPPWHSELNTARFCFAYAVGYDCIYDYLSDQDRKTIRESMIRLGILPTLNDWILSGKRIHALDSMGHNWWSVCVSMAGLAAMSILGDDPRAETWVHQVARAFPEWFLYSGNLLQNKSRNFGRSGAFYESVSYANYALSEYLLFRLAYSNVFPSVPPPHIPLLEKTGDFFVHTSYPTTSELLSANFGDSSIEATGGRTLQLLWANGFDSEEYRWCLQRSEIDLSEPINLVYHDWKRPVVQRPALPDSFCFGDIGWAIMRSSWEDDATMLAVKSGFTWNHAHPDAGSFLLFHGGRPIIIDSGRCSYSRREYTSYYRHSRAHNVILFNGEAQNTEDCARGDRGVATPGSVHQMLDTADVKYVFADATGPTSWRFSRNYRHFLWLEGVILIIDDVRTHESGQFEWLLHYAGQMKRSSDLIEIANGEQNRVTVKSLFPTEINIVEKTGLKDNEPDTKVSYLAFQPKTETQHTKFLTAIVPTSSHKVEEIPTVRRLEGDGMIGARIENKETVTDVFLNLNADGRKMHRNSCNTIDGWETDAYIFAISRQREADPSSIRSITRCFVAGGSYLRRDDTVILGSLSKVFAIFTTCGPNMQVGLKGQPWMNVSLWTKTEPQTVKLNGKPVDVSYDDNRHSVSLSVHTP